MRGKATEYDLGRQNLAAVTHGSPESLPSQQQAQHNSILTGLEEFAEFDPREPRRVEALRFIRTAGWFARHWDAPAFATAFPRANTQQY